MNSVDKEPSHWKFGLFYNKEDKRIFPPKRFGFGWTINFANPLSVSAFLLILMIIGLLARFLK
jgi:uncharacterized membrane protein